MKDFHTCIKKKIRYSIDGVSCLDDCFYFECLRGINDVVSERYVCNLFMKKLKEDKSSFDIYRCKKCKKFFKGE